MKKRLLALVLTVAMLLSVFPAQVFATENHEEHTEHSFTEVQPEPSTPPAEPTEAPTENVTEAPTEEVTEAPTEEVTEALTEDLEDQETFVPVLPSDENTVSNDEAYLNATVGQNEVGTKVAQAHKYHCLLSYDCIEGKAFGEKCAHYKEYSPINTQWFKDIAQEKITVPGVRYVPSSKILYLGTDRSLYFYFKENVTLPSEIDRIVIKPDEKPKDSEELGVNLCLNGYQLNLTDRQIDVSTYGDLRISDCNLSDNGKGIITSSFEGSTIHVYENGTLRLYDGTVENNRKTGKDTICAVYSLGTVNVFDATVKSSFLGLFSVGGKTVIHGGNFQGTTAIYQKESGDLEIEGGTISSQNGRALHCTGGTVTIKGGTISSQNGRGIHAAGGTLNISGGTISSQNERAIHATGGTVTISGGEFTSEYLHTVHINGANATVSGGTITHDRPEGVPEPEDAEGNADPQYAFCMNAGKLEVNGANVKILGNCDTALFVGAGATATLTAGTIKTEGELKHGMYNKGITSIDGPVSIQSNHYGIFNDLETADLSITAGTIKGYTGIHNKNGATLKLSGSPEIISNGRSADINLSEHGQNFITVDGPLTPADGGVITVIKKPDPTPGAPVQFTLDWDPSECDKDVFASPTKEFGIRLTADKEELAIAVVHCHSLSQDGTAEVVDFDQPLTTELIRSFPNDSISTYIPEGNYFLTSDLTLNIGLIADANVNICLNGHTITLVNGRGKAYWGMLSAGVGNKLSVCNCSDSGAIISQVTNSFLDKPPAVSACEGSILLNDLTIINTAFDNSVGVSTYITVPDSVIINNCNITGKLAGIYNETGDITVNGGSITSMGNNTSGIYNKVTVRLNGVNVSGKSIGIQNTATGTCTVNGGNIDGATYGIENAGTVSVKNCYIGQGRTAVTYADGEAIFMPFLKGTSAADIKQWGVKNCTAQMDTEKGILYGNIEQTDPHVWMNPDTTSENFNYLIKEGDILETRLRTKLDQEGWLNVESFFIVNDMYDENNNYRYAYTKGWGRNGAVSHNTDAYQTVEYEVYKSVGLSLVGYTIEKIRLDPVVQDGGTTLSGYYEYDYFYFGPEDRSPKSIMAGVDKADYGVYNKAGSTFSMGSDVDIYGTTADVYLAKDAKITIAENITPPEDGFISVDTQIDPQVGAPVQITTNWTNSGSTSLEDDTFVLSSKDGYTVRRKNNELWLVIAHEHYMSPNTASGGELTDGSTPAYVIFRKEIDSEATLNSYHVNGVLPAGDYVLTNGFTYNSNLTLNGNVNLCLNGYTLDLGSNQMILKSGAILNICDCNGSKQGQGMITSNIYGAVIDATYGAVNLYSGTLQNTYENNTIPDNDTNDDEPVNTVIFGKCGVNIFGGAIHSSARNAIRVTSGGLYISGGEIVQTGPRNAAIFITHDATQEVSVVGGDIQSDYYGIVFNLGKSLTIEGSTTRIVGSTAVRVDHTVATITGGYLEGTVNNAITINNDGQVTVNGPVTLVGKTKGIGANSPNSKLTVSAGNISSKTDYGIYTKGTLNLTGGTVSATTDTNGYGVYVEDGTFNLSGNPSISGTAADIYLAEGKLVNVTDLLTGSEHYSVLTEKTAFTATPEGGISIQITEGFKQNGNSNNLFESVNPAYISLVRNDEVYFVTKSPITVEVEGNGSAFAKDENGNLITKALEDDTVVIEATPNTGNFTGRLVLTYSEGGNQVSTEMSPDENGDFTFTMPGGDVTAKVYFYEIHTHTLADGTVITYDKVLTKALIQKYGDEDSNSRPRLPAGGYLVVEDNISALGRIAIAGRVDLCLYGNTVNFAGQTYTNSHVLRIDDCTGNGTLNMPQYIHAQGSSAKLILAGGNLYGNASDHTILMQDGTFVMEGGTFTAGKTANYAIEYYESSPVETFYFRGGVYTAQNTVIQTNNAKVTFSGSPTINGGPADIYFAGEAHPIYFEGGEGISLVPPPEETYRILSGASVPTGGLKFTSGWKNAKISADRIPFVSTQGYAVREINNELYLVIPKVEVQVNDDTMGSAVISVDGSEPANVGYGKKDAKVSVTATPTDNDKYVVESVKITYWNGAETVVQELSFTTDANGVATANFTMPAADCTVMVNFRKKHIHCVYGHYCPMGENCNHEKIEYSIPLDQALFSQNNLPAGNYFLTEDVSFTGQYHFAGSNSMTNICLNDHDINIYDKDNKNSGNLISNNGGGSPYKVVNFTDCSGAAYISCNYLFIKENARINMYGITLYTKSNEAAVAAENNSFFYFEGGKITTNTAIKHDGAIYSYKGSCSGVKLVDCEIKSIGSNAIVQWEDQGKIEIEGWVKINGATPQTPDFGLQGGGIIYITGALDLPTYNVDGKELKEIYPVKTSASLSGTETRKITSGWQNSGLASTADKVAWIPFTSTQGYAVRELEVDGVKELYLAIPKATVTTNNTDEIHYGDAGISIDGNEASNPNYGLSGKAAVVTATPAGENSLVSSITLTYWNGAETVVQELSFTTDANGVATANFTMPAADVEVLVTFRRIHRHYVSTNTNSGAALPDGRTPDKVTFDREITNNEDLKSYLLSNSILPAGNYVLMGDEIFSDTMIKITEGTVNLCLKGSTLHLGKDYSDYIRVESGATLNICDCSRVDPEGALGSGKISRVDADPANNESEMTGHPISRHYGIWNEGSLNIYGGTYHVEGKKDISTLYIETRDTQKPAVLNLYSGLVTAKGFDTGSTACHILGVQAFNSGAVVNQYNDARVEAIGYGVPQVPNTTTTTSAVYLYNFAIYNLHDGEIYATSAGDNLIYGVYCTAPGTEFYLYDGLVKAERDHAPENINGFVRGIGSSGKVFCSGGKVESDYYGVYVFAETGGNGHYLTVSGDALIHGDHTGICNVGTTTVTGGTVIGGTFGVYHHGTKFNLSGSPVITGDGRADIYLTNDSTGSNRVITIIGELGKTVETNGVKEQHFEDLYYVLTPNALNTSTNPIRITEDWGDTHHIYDQSKGVFNHPFRSKAAYHVYVLPADNVADVKHQNQDVYFALPLLEAPLTLYVWKDHDVLITREALLNAMLDCDPAAAVFTKSETYELDDVQFVNDHQIADLTFTPVDGGYKFSSSATGTGTGRIMFHYRAKDNNTVFTAFVDVELKSYFVKDSVFVLDYANAAKLTDGLFAQDILPGVGQDVTAIQEAFTMSEPNFAKDGLSMTVSSQGGTGLYGVFSVEDGKTYYTANKMIDGVDSTYLILRVVKNGENASDLFKIDPFKEAEMYKKVTILPANVVYYEDNFTALTYGTTVTMGTENKITILGGQDPDIYQDPTDGNYGNDASYEKPQENGSGNVQHKITVNGFGTVLSFNFVGTGFDIIGRTTADSGSLIVMVKDETNTSVYTRPVDTIFVEDGGAIYEVPLVHVTDLKHGSYLVEILSVPTYDFEQTPAAIVPSTLYIDGVRIYNALNVGDKDRNEYYADGEKDAEFVEVRNLVLSGKAAAAKVDKGSFTFGSGTISYTQTVTTGTKKYSYTGNKVTSANDYLIAGPNNELYMNDSNQAIVFYVKAKDTKKSPMLQIGIRDLNDAAFDSRDGDTDKTPILQFLAKYGEESNVIFGVEGATLGYTEQYYTVDLSHCDTEVFGDNTYYRVVLMARNNAALSLTNVKYSNLEFYTIPNQAATLIYDKDGQLVDITNPVTKKMPNLQRLALQMQTAAGILPEDELDSEEHALNFAAVSLSLKSSIGMNYYVLSDTLKDLADAYIVVTVDEVDSAGEFVTQYSYKLDTYELTTTGGKDYAVFRMNEITAKEMNANIVATLYAKDTQGKEITGETRSYNPATYAVNMLAKPNTAPALRTLLTDMLNYGAAAQIHFNYNYNGDETKLANYGIDQTYATKEDPILNNFRDTGMNGESHPAQMYAASLSLKDTVEVNFYVKVPGGIDLSKLAVRVDYTDIEGNEQTQDLACDYEGITEGLTDMKLVFKDLTAPEMRTILKAYVIYDGARYSNQLTYSIESYAAAQIAKDDPLITSELKDLLNKMMKYGDSSRAYFLGLQSTNS